MAVRQLKDGRWIVYYRAPGKDGKSTVKREYFGRGPEGEAAANVRDKELDFKPRRPRNVDYGPSFMDIADSYYKNKNLNDNSRKHLKIRLEVNIYPFFGNIPAIRITDQDVDNYIKQRRKNGVKYSTIRRELTDVKSILNWAVKRRPPLIPFNPVRDYKLPKADYDIIKPPTMDEVKKILAEAAPHLQRAFKLSYYLGLRPGAVELMSLTWADVDFNEQSILVRSAHKGGPESRYVPVHPQFMDELKQWYIDDNEQGPIIHYHGRAIKKIQKSWEGALKRAGIKRRLRPYDLRHHFVTKSLEAGADIKALSEVVGSKPETLMKHYQHVTSKMHRDAVSKIPPIE